jgi:hypothetical protein
MEQSRIMANKKYKPQTKYDSSNTTQIKLKLNLNTDADILAYLEKADNKQGTIKRLIREEISKEQA